ncbi:hypothetical protein NDU88_003486 [Pleurodeles waltl]|uniref:Uncharacterized protein n=1 Tax=Pleurodeles waltl TaxID=8319 RepID=A0AAV7WRI9_PLEWA|nr:hypothetical protein NDU88_003486 [Pleurodeles waltl]
MWCCANDSCQFLPGTPLPPGEPGRALGPAGQGRVVRGRGSARLFNRVLAMEQQPTRPAPDFTSLQRSSTTHHQLLSPPARVGTKKENTRPQTAGQPGPTEHGSMCAADMLCLARGDRTRPCTAPRGTQSVTGDVA